MHYAGEGDVIHSASEEYNTYMSQELSPASNCGLTQSMQGTERVVSLASGMASRFGHRHGQPRSQATL